MEKPLNLIKIYKLLLSKFVGFEKKQRFYLITKKHVVINTGNRKTSNSYSELKK